MQPTPNPTPEAGGVRKLHAEPVHGLRDLHLRRGRHLLYLHRVREFIDEWNDFTQLPRMTLHSFTHNPYMVCGTPTYVVAGIFYLLTGYHASLLEGF